LLDGGCGLNPKDVVLAYVDAFNRGDLDGLCALLHPTPSAGAASTSSAPSGAT
jgi:ketosteroid isomerase-like protein